MKDPDLICRNEQRRQAVRDQANKDDGLNGIDYVEVVEGTGGTELCVHFFGDVPQNLVPENVRIHGGARIRDIEAVKVQPRLSDDPEHEDCLLVVLDKTGDFSCYTLCLYRVDKHGHTTKKKLKGFDPRYVCADFSFKLDCPSEMDCRADEACPQPERVEPVINYLARDYGSFRQLLLDRLSLIMPEWRERHLPDIGIAMVEMLAYAGDHLSYYQDAVATEAYLDTARERISVGRHARLVNYQMHEGCNARAWLTVETNTDVRIGHAGDLSFITACEKLLRQDKRTISRDEFEKLRIPAGDYEVFEPVAENKCEPLEFFVSHNNIYFYTWGDTECCLPRGATRATLKGKLAGKDDKNDGPFPDGPNVPDQQQQQQQQQALLLPKYDKADDGPVRLHLQAGDVLIFEEIYGPKTGDKADFDPRRRCAVRLTEVESSVDPLTGTDIVEITWARADALRFELCISSFIGATGSDAVKCKTQKNISVARGNVVLVDHGRTVCPEDCGEVAVKETVADCSCEGSELEYTYIAEKFAPRLQRHPLTYVQSYSRKLPASLCIDGRDPREALPGVALWGRPANDKDLDTALEKKELCSCETDKWNWYPRHDLLDSGGGDRHFVVEIDDEGAANLRFGDGDCGLMPEALTAFAARYRIGNGRAGNVAPEAIAYIITREVIGGLDAKPRNPMAAAGGLDAEPIAEVKLFAPGAFRKRRERAITAGDYAELAMRNEKVQQAAARLRWSGSWREASVDIDPFDTEELSGSLRRKLRGSLYPYRRIGHDLRVGRARYVPLHIALRICVAPHYQRGHVEAALRDVFGTRALPGGRRGFFHPDNLTFGDGITLSSLVAAALSVEGVVNAEVIKLERLFEGPNNERENGILPLGVGEVAQLDSDRNFPERGLLKFEFEGGRQ